MFLWLDESVGTPKALYERAQLQRPSVILRRRRLQLVGHVIRAESYCPSPSRTFCCSRCRDHSGGGRAVPGDPWT